MISLLCPVKIFNEIACGSIQKIQAFPPSFLVRRFSVCPFTENFNLTPSLFQLFHISVTATLVKVTCRYNSEVFNSAQKQRKPNFLKNKQFLPSDMGTYFCVSGGIKFLFFLKNWRALFFCNHCFV